MATCRGNQTQSKRASEYGLETHAYSSTRRGPSVTRSPETIVTVDAVGLFALLRSGPLLADGGMGTSLIDLGAQVEACFEALNVTDPELVEGVHRGFVNAGARLVLTNTFGGNRFRLERHGVADKVAEFNLAAVAPARRSGAEIVGGSIGPLGVRLAPYGRVRSEDAFEAYREQAVSLAAAGVDLLVIETQTDLREMEQALAAAREAAPGLAVAVSATYTKDDRTLLGSTPEQVASRLVELGADAIGVNCGEGPAQVLRVVRATTPYAGGLPIFARPNAGGPTAIGGRFVYPARPDYVGELAHALLEEGAAVDRRVLWNRAVPHRRDRGGPARSGFPRPDRVLRRHQLVSRARFRGS